MSDEKLDQRLSLITLGVEEPASPSAPMGPPRSAIRPDRTPGRAVGDVLNRASARRVLYLWSHDV